MASCGAPFPAMPVRAAVQADQGHVSGGWTPLPASPVVLKHEGLPGSEVSREGELPLTWAALCEASPVHPY